MSNNQNTYDTLRSTRTSDEKKKADRQRMMLYYRKFVADGNPFTKLFRSPKAMAWFAVDSLLFAGIIYYVLPILPEVTYAGTFGAALFSGFIMRLLTYVAGGFFSLRITEAARRFAYNEPSFKYAALSFLILFILGPVQITVIAIYPGCLVLHGFWGFVLANIVMFSIMTLIHGVWLRHFPLPKIDIDTAAK